MHRHHKDDAGQLLREFWKPDGKTAHKENEARLRKHIAGTSSISLFLHAHSFAEQRRKTASALGLR